MTPKQQRGEATVTHVLDAALRIYAAEGESGLTVSAITRASDVSAGSVYHHFGSLQGVLNALAIRATAGLWNHIVQALAGATGARAGIEAAVRAYLEYVGTHPDEARILHSAVADREVMTRPQVVRDFQEARMPPVAQWLRDRIEAGELVDLPSPLLESLILGPVVGVARRWLSIGDVDLERAADALPDRIWRSVSA
ncbi:TetR/AcrR family transcriptional regulator [Streptomyces sp. NPDC001941]|uniref:TetR/AcrR family transcriptional regulator n=1 Tax=Streptomyces sp. NPDC001941 TaxID=3154659 RepID=UPI00333279BB